MRTIGAIALAVMLAIVNFADAGGETVKLGDFSSKLPEGWKSQKPSSTLRKYQFVVPKVEGDKEDADLAVFGSVGGTVEQNVARWKGLFIAPEGKSIDDVSKLDKFKVGKIAEVTYFDISGTYLFTDPSKSGAKAVRKENFRRINVIFDTEQGAFVITLAGPAKTMEKHKQAFDGWIKAFK